MHTHPCRHCGIPIFFGTESCSLCLEDRRLPHNSSLPLPAVSATYEDILAITKSADGQRPTKAEFWMTPLASIRCRAVRDPFGRRIVEDAMTLEERPRLLGFPFQIISPQFKLDSAFAFVRNGQTDALVWHRLMPSLIEIPKWPSPATSRPNALCDQGLF